MVKLSNNSMLTVTPVTEEIPILINFVHDRFHSSTAYTWLCFICQYRFVGLPHYSCDASSINEALSNVTSVNEVNIYTTDDH